MPANSGCMQLQGHIIPRKLKPPEMPPGNRTIMPSWAEASPTPRDSTTTPNNHLKTDRQIQEIDNLPTDPFGKPFTQAHQHEQGSSITGLTLAMNGSYANGTTPQVNGVLKEVNGVNGHSSTRSQSSKHVTVVEPTTNGSSTNSNTTQTTRRIPMHDRKLSNPLAPRLRRACGSPRQGCHCSRHLTAIIHARDDAEQIKTDRQPEVLRH
jgi:hypothetical protein